MTADRAADLIIERTTVIDGTGAPSWIGDVAVTATHVSALGELGRWAATTRVDGTGLALSPGFIDVHSHDDLAVLESPDMSCKISQGVTTVVVGNCGVSAAPLYPTDVMPTPFPLLGPPDSFRFPTVPDYRAALDDEPPTVNVALLAGHTSLRLGAMGRSLDRAATGAEIDLMARWLDRALTDGCAGLSSGLEYPPANAAPTDELVELARVLAGHPGAIYATHVRDEADGVVDAVREALETGRRARTPVLISHHKCAGSANHGRTAETLPMIDAAARSHEVALDVYPYTAASTMLIPEFVRDAESVLVGWSDSHPQWAGQRLDAVAEAWGCTAEEAAARLHPASAIYFRMHEDDLRRIVAHPLSMIGSDGLPGRGRPHPRLWGTFPRVLARYVRETGLLTLSEAVHKMTGRPASVLGIADRGEIAVGRAADLVLFDPDTVLDTATYEEPETAAVGITMVIVNGEIAWRDGRPTSARPGRFLSRAAG